MPIKLPKGFPRRKSSGNVLDEITKTDENRADGTSSFKVLARPSSTGKSLGSSTAFQHGQFPPKSSFDEDNEDLFSVVRPNALNRSSDTSNSLTTLPNESAGSSTRYSNSSTNPSSVDSGSGRNIKTTNQRYYEEATVSATPAQRSSKDSSRTGFRKHAGRTFSFGLVKHHPRESTDVPPLPAERVRRATLTESRERAATISSVTTADPPRLDDSSFSIKGTNDDFGSMFASYGSNQSKENINSARPAPYKSAQQSTPLPSLPTSYNMRTEASHYNMDSQISRDGLLGTPSPARTVVRNSPQLPIRNFTSNTILSDASNEENMFEDSPLRRSPEQYPTHPVSLSRNRAGPPSSFPTVAMTRARTQSTGNSSIQKSEIDASDFPPFDSSLLANAQLATQYTQKSSSPRFNEPGKVMTPAEFERYKQQKEDTRRYNKVFGRTNSDDGSGDEYDDDEEDEHEREKLVVKQRKKQEAHLAVYRQQMMKVTGDAPSEHRPDLQASSSQLDLGGADGRMSQLNLDARQSSFGSIGKLAIDDEPDEDEDVPLGILAAHGFPNKNRPPNRLVSSTSNQNLRHLSSISGSASVAGAESNRGSLPAFARHLPADPYYGASLVQQPERTSMAMHSNMSQSQLATQPQPSGSSTAHPLHPAGLVGVIAGEERARAMRRGSPNPQGGYDMPMGSPQARPMSQMPQFPNPGMMMPPQQMLSPAEHAQLQMSQSMQQMMQMQMQWMQQMTSMMGQNPNMQMQMPMMGMPSMSSMPNIPSMPSMQSMHQIPQMQQNGAPMVNQQHPGIPHRPQSVPLQQMNGGDRRTMSTLSPSMTNWNHSSPAIPQINTRGSVYAPSIAPSERSNIGLASRYRPVTANSAQQQQPEANYSRRASTFSTATFKPWVNEKSNHKPTPSTIRAVRNNDDDDDEEGWAEMKARKEKKQRSWKLRKGGNQLQELYNAPA